MKKLWSRFDVLAVLVIALVGFLSIFKTLGFYFWHDDFSILYGARIGECILKWPYTSSCTIFAFLDKFFNYSPTACFLLGAILAILTSVAFYFFLKEFFPERVAFLVALVFSTGYIGGGAFLEVANSSTTSFLSLGSLFIALTLFARAFKEKLRIRLFLAALLVFSLSLVVLRARSMMYLPLALVIVFFFSEKSAFSQRLKLIFVITLTFMLVYFVLPLGADFWQTIEGLIGFGVSSQANLGSKINYFFQTVSSFILTDFLQVKFLAQIKQENLEKLRIFLGLLATIVFLWFLLLDRKEKQNTKIRLLALVWVILLYLPYGLRTDWRLESTSRYILFAYPGVLLAWASFYRGRLWPLMTVILVILGIFQSNWFFKPHLEANWQRADFYSQLHQQLKEISQGAILFFDFPQKVRHQANDFFRAGYRPSESALGAEFKADYSLFKLIAESPLLARKIKMGEVEVEKLFTFYYDGAKLLDTTQDSRKLLAGSGGQTVAVNKVTKMQFFYDQKFDKWSGKKEELGFSIDGLIPLLPFRMRLRIKASVPSFPLPYTQGCVECHNGENQEIILRYLSEARRLKKMVKAEASISGEETFPGSLVDNNRETYWVGNRQAWFKGEKPKIHLSFEGKKQVVGVVIYSSFESRIPTRLAVKINNQPVEHSAGNWPGGTKLLFDPTAVQRLEIQFLETKGGDVPMIDEVEVIPPGYEEINLVLAEKIKKAPAANIGNEKEKLALINYLASGANACVIWESSQYGQGTEPFHLMADDQTHLYEIDLPSMGMGQPVFRLGCLDYPVNVRILGAQVSF